MDDYNEHYTDHDNGVVAPPPHIDTSLHDGRRDDDRRKLRRLRMGALIALGLMLGVSLILGGIALADSGRSRGSLTNIYRKSFLELCTSVSDLEVELSKLTVTTSQKQYILQLSDIWRRSGEVSANLAMLPVAHKTVRDLNRFIVQLGDYCHYLTQKAAGGEPIVADDMKQIAELHAQCALINQAMLELQHGEMDYEAFLTSGFSSETESQTDKLYQPEEDYPHLIYDGPFSDSTENRRALSLRLPEVTEQQAQDTAIRALGAERIQSMQFGGEQNGDIPCYVFGGMTKDNREFSVLVARNGGQLLYFSEQATGADTAVPEDQLLKRLNTELADYLSTQGFPNMQATYSQYYNGLVVINFAAKQDHVLLYPDLVKVWYDVGAQRVTGMEARNYLYCHTQRTIPAEFLTLGEARALTSPNLEITSQRLCVIPMDNLKEYFCYEFRGTVGGNTYLVYINAVSGEEENFLRLLKTPEGDLVM